MRVAELEIPPTYTTLGLLGQGHSSWLSLRTGRAGAKQPRISQAGPDDNRLSALIQMLEWASQYLP
jgi:hypothetical protein